MNKISEAKLRSNKLIRALQQEVLSKQWYEKTFQNLKNY